VRKMLRVLRKLFRRRKDLVVRFRLDFDLIVKRWKFIENK
jgi:hypothetical protein